MTIVPVILAGGSGERLWPVSKRDYPKQFALQDAAGHSLFQATVLRVLDAARFEPPVVVCNEAHRFIVADQLRAIDVPYADILIEPEPRNTAPAIMLALAHIAATTPKAAAFILPSDHRIDAPETLLAALPDALNLARAGSIVTFGITPTRPDTGYGYIRRGKAITEDGSAFHAEAFVEKPAADIAASYLASGDYLWNSGMFFADVAVLAARYEAAAHAIYKACKLAYLERHHDGLFIRADAHALRECPSISFDHAVMEHAGNVAVIPLAMGWSDLGTWASLAEAGPRDARDNCLRGNVITRDVTQCLIHSDKPTVAAIGLTDMVIVAADDAVLVGPHDRMGEVKALLEQMRADSPADLRLTTHVYKPWGHATAIDSGEHYKVKKLSIRPGEQISLQRHRHRSEHWVVVKGRATVTCGEEIRVLEENESIYIAAGQVHRLRNAEAGELVVIEVQTGDYLEEDDIERLEDAYQRVG